MIHSCCLFVYLFIVDLSVVVVVNVSSKHIMIRCLDFCVMNQYEYLLLIVSIQIPVISVSFKMAIVDNICIALYVLDLLSI